MDEGTVITFYSYKGGVGRTLALANIAALLSSWGYKVLCIDWDLEAPGLHLYFKKWLIKADQNGLTDLIHDFIDGNKPDWQDYIVRVNIPNINHLHLMIAGKQNTLYVKKVQDLDWVSLYENYNLGSFLEDLRSQWKNTYDFIL